jgi:hypothetical protein
LGRGPLRCGLKWAAGFSRDRTPSPGKAEAGFSNIEVAGGHPWAYLRGASLSGRWPLAVLSLNLPCPLPPSFPPASSLCRLRMLVFLDGRITRRRPVPT